MSVGSMLQFHRVAMHTLTLLLQLEGSPAFIHCSSEQCVGLQGECPSMDPTSDSTPQLQLVVLQVGWARVTQYDPVRV